MKSGILKFTLVVIVVLLIGHGLTRTSEDDIGNGQPRLAERIVTIGDTMIAVELARTDEERRRGLSGRASLRDGIGMLFVFPSMGRLGFWMKDMRFPLDLMWIDDGFRVVHIVQGVSPDTYPKVFNPEVPARYVLEVSAGTVERLSLKAGDTVSVEEI